MSVVEVKEKLANDGAFRENSETAMRVETGATGRPEIYLYSSLHSREQSFDHETCLLEPTEGNGRQSDTATEKQKKGTQGTVEQITMHQKGNRMVVAMDEQEEPEGCASCGQKGVKTFQYQMCRSCLAKKLRGIQDFIDEQRKEIFGDR